MFCVQHQYCVMGRCEMLNESSELDSEVMAQMEDEFTQEGEMPKQPTSQDLSADYTTNMVDEMQSPLQPDCPTSNKVFQFSGFTNEVGTTKCNSQQVCCAHVVAVYKRVVRM